MSDEDGELSSGSEDGASRVTQLVPHSPPVSSGQRRLQATDADRDSASPSARVAFSLASRNISSNSLKMKSKSEASFARDELAPPPPAPSFSIGTPEKRRRQENAGTSGSDEDMAEQRKQQRHRRRDEEQKPRQHSKRDYDDAEAQLRQRLLEKRRVPVEAPTPSSSAPNLAKSRSDDTRRRRDDDGRERHHRSHRSSHKDRHHKSRSRSRERGDRKDRKKPDENRPTVVTKSAAPAVDVKPEKTPPADVEMVEPVPEEVIELDTAMEEDAKPAAPSRPYYSKFDSDEEGSGKEEDDRRTAGKQQKGLYSDSDSEDRATDVSNAENQQQSPKREREDGDESLDEILAKMDAGERAKQEQLDEPSKKSNGKLPDDTTWEDLDDEQRAALSPDSRDRLKAAWQKRVVATLPIYFPGISGCRSVNEFDCLNRIEEGTYGVVYRAKEKRTDEVVALKRLKMEKERDGFPITSLREVNMLLKCGCHENIVHVKEIVLGSDMNKIFMVMEYVEHDLKSLMEELRRRGQKFKSGEVKTLMRQLLRGLAHMHELWILHRDLKTSNLLLNHRGILKIADFGLAREYGEPLKPYTGVVVTLWYRAPELLFGTKYYSTAIDLWSAGCIMGEFLTLKPVFQSSGELDAINRICMELGTPSESCWPGFEELPGAQKLALPQHKFNQLRKRFPANMLTDTGFKLLNRLLTYSPKERITASQALRDAWYAEEPAEVPPDMFPTWPAKSERAPGMPMPPAQQQQQNKPKQQQQQGKKGKKGAVAEPIDLEELYKQMTAPAAAPYAIKFDVPKF